MDSINQIDRLLRENDTMNNNRPQSNEFMGISDSINLDRPTESSATEENDDDDEDAVSVLSDLENFVPSSLQQNHHNNDPIPPVSNIIPPPVTTTESGMQTNNNIQLPGLLRGFMQENVHSTFNYDEFNRRILLKYIQKDPIVGQEIQEMGVRIEKADRTMLNYMHKFVCTVSERKFSNNMDLKNCLMIIEFCKTMVQIFLPEDSPSISEELETIKHIIDHTDYNIGIINEVAAMSPEELKSDIPQPMKRTLTLLVQMILTVGLKKAPIIVQKISEKYGGKIINSNGEDDLIPPAKRRKFT